MLTTLEKLENAQNRKAIVVLGPSNYELAKISEKNKYFKNDEIAIIDLSDDRLKENRIYKKLYDDGLLSNGNVLLQDPYYWDIYSIAQTPDNLIGNNAITKYGLFATFCGLLGAKDVEIKQINVKNSEGEITAEGKFNNLGCKIKGNIDQNRVEDISNKLEIHRSFKNKGIDLKKAEQLLETCHLKNDKCFLEVLYAYDRYEHFGTSINLTAESNSVLKIAAEITLPTWNLTAEFQNKLKTKEIIDINVSIDFY